MTRVSVEFTINSVVCLLAFFTLSGAFTLMHLNGVALPYLCVQIIRLCAVLQMVPVGILLMGFVLGFVAHVQNSLRM